MRPYGWFGLLLFIVSAYCLFRKIEPFFAWFYCFAWWSYILLADNLLLKLRGKSLLTGRRRELGAMLPLSVFIWLIFEAFNFRLNNWAYSVAPMEPWQRWIGYAISYATVLPGIFITSDLVDLLWKQGPPAAASECVALSPDRRFTPSFLLTVPGLILTAAPLIWPRYFFPAVWLGPIFLLDPFIGKAGIQSLLSLKDAGNRRRVCSLMLGGLFCGFLWELWNYRAGSKWMYTVPFFDGWKVFEMPALGFLGFPPFALECWILYHLMRAISRHMDSPALRITWWAGVGLISLCIMQGIDKYTLI